MKEQLDSTSTVVLSIHFQTHHELWQHVIELIAKKAPMIIDGMPFAIISAAIDPWDQNRRVIIMQAARSYSVTTDDVPKSDLPSNAEQLNSGVWL